MSMEPWLISLQTGWLVGGLWNLMDKEQKLAANEVVSTFYRNMTDADVKRAEEYLRVVLIPMAQAKGISIDAMPGANGKKVVL